MGPHITAMMTAEAFKNGACLTTQGGMVGIGWKEDGRGEKSAKFASEMRFCSQKLPQWLGPFMGLFGFLAVELQQQPLQICLVLPSSENPSYS